MNGFGSPAIGGARALGFQPALSPAERNHFVTFSENTKGRSGRPVFIDARLLPQFLSLIDVDTAKGQRIVRGIEGLRSIGGGISSYQSTSRAARHMSLLEEVEVYYFIEQAQANGMPAGLFITSLKRVAKGASVKADIYLVDKSGYTATNNTFFTLNDAALSSAASVGDSVSETAQHAAPDGWGGIATREVFFIPSKLANEKGNWLCPMEKQSNPVEIENKISHTLEQTQKRQQSLKKGEPIRIQVHGEACKFIAGALNRSSGHIDSLDFQFIEPVGNIALAINSIKNKNGKNSSPIISTNKASLISLSQVRFQLSQALADTHEKNLSKGVKESTAATTAILNASRSISNNSVFLNAVKQANRLGRWTK